MASCDLAGDFVSVATAVKRAGVLAWAGRAETTPTGMRIGYRMVENGYGPNSFLDEHACGAERAQVLPGTAAKLLKIKNGYGPAWY